MPYIDEPELVFRDDDQVLTSQVGGRGTQVWDDVPLLWAIPGPTNYITRGGTPPSEVMASSEMEA